MYANTLTPKLPSGHQMALMQLPLAVQDQLHTIAMQVLQRLLVPLLCRYRLRKARAAMERQYLAQQASPDSIAQAAEAALQHVSVLGAVSRDLYTTPQDTAATTTTATAAMPSGESHPSLTASQDGPTPSYPTSPGPAPFFATEAATSNAAAARAELHAVVRSSLVRLRTYLHDERVEWEWEPASEVMILLAGAVERRGCAVAVARAMAAHPFSGGAGPSAHHSRRSSALLGHASSRRGSASLQAPPNPAAPPKAGQQRTSSAGQSDRPFSAGAGSGRGAYAGPSAFRRGSAGDQDAQVCAAPQVFGELACLGGYPYCAALTVSSPTAVFLCIPKEVYCRLVSECVPVDGQRRLMVEALQMRERLLPYYAPLSPARLLLCPLLTHLRPEQLEHIRDLAVPRVYAAGMECGEREAPRHIFFIRRGVVHMQRDGAATGGSAAAAAAMQAGSGAASEYSSQHTATAAVSRASYSLQLPKNRSVLVEGHTYGETGCIFGDALGDRYRAVTHVDMYLLPFQVLIQLMKQVPEVQSTVYRSAQELSVLRDKEWPGVLFGPRQCGVELADVHGLVPAQGLLAHMAAVPATQNTDWHTHSSHHKRGSTSSSGGGGGGVGHDPLSRYGGPSSGSVTRRVTIFEDASTAGASGGHGHEEGHAGGGLTGGRVSTALLTAMELLPVVSLLPSFSAAFSKACMQQWQCVTYTRGDVIAPAGHECSRLLFFFEGRAGIVRNATLLRNEQHEHQQQSGPFGAPDMFSASAEAVCPIPAGHVVGYTCVRRHRWTHTIIALDDVVEVWELRRNAFVQLLRSHGMERDMQTAALQLLQPLATQKERLAVLDYQPLLHPMPNSLWGQQSVPNVHPVVTTREGVVCFPVWREGDFPLDRRGSVAESAASRVGSGGGGRRSTLTGVGAVKGAAIANERQRRGDSPVQSAVRSGSVTALSDSDNAARSNFIARLTSTA